MTTPSTPEATTVERAWWRSRRILVVGTTAVLLGALAVGTAYGAGSRSSKNTINGCVNDRTGVLRVIDPAKGGRCDGRRG